MEVAADNTQILFTDTEVGVLDGFHMSGNTITISFFQPFKNVSSHRHLIQGTGRCMWTSDSQERIAEYSSAPYFIHSREPRAPGSVSDGHQVVTQT